jgi:hypothetical protein
MPDGADLTLRKEACHGDRTQLFCDGLSVVVRPSKESLTATAATEY